MASRRKILLIILGIILVTLFAIGAIFGDPFFIIIFIFVGISVILLFISFVLEKFFPKNKISKTLENILEWIIDNIHF